MLIGGRRKNSGFQPEVIEPLKEKSRAGRRPAALIFTFVIMMVTWVVLSGRLDAFHLGLGVFSCALVAWFSSDLIFAENPGGATLALWGRFLIYLPWLIWQIVLANFHVLGVILSPRMKELVDPHMVRLKSDLEGQYPLITFANSITLTPGTITVYVARDGRLTVHALDRKCGDVQALKDMEAKVGRTFGQRLDQR